MTYSKLWVTWEHQPRNISMANCLNAEYFEVHSANKGYRRYVSAIYKTLLKVQNGYDLIFVQNPSIVLSLLAVLVGFISNSKIVIDAHNAGVFPAEGRHLVLQKINLWILRRSDLVIVSNGNLAKYLENAGVFPTIALPDPIPDVKPLVKKRELSHKQTVFVICSWSEDEPIQLYLDIAEQFPEVTFEFSGNYRKMITDKSRLSRNISLLGFIDEDQYYQHLLDSSVVLDLTTRENCLVCGAYEALAYGKPVILSESEVNTEVFNYGALLTGHSLEELNLALTKALSCSEDLSRLAMMRAIEMKEIEREYLSRVFGKLNIFQSS